MDLLDDLQQARCADPFACLGLHTDSQSKGVSLTVWQPGAIGIEVLALEQDTLLGTMHSAQKNGLFSIHWPEQETHFHYRLKIQYHDHELIRVDPYQFAQTTLNEVPHHSTPKNLHQGANPASCKINNGINTTP